MNYALAKHVPDKCVTQVCRSPSREVESTYPRKPVVQESKKLFSALAYRRTRFKWSVSERETKNNGPEKRLLTSSEP